MIWDPTRTDVGNANSHSSHSQDPTERKTPQYRHSQKAEPWQVITNLQGRLHWLGQELGSHIHAQHQQALRWSGQ